ncbi:MAG: desulfoferrodoxin [Thaumarchaeota archaeon]|nr:desulfoferrodoxin [Nitrososphaerota archaeon]
MTERLQIYKCNVCGNIVMVLHPGAGTLVCCNQPMQPLEEKMEEVGREKHVPIIEKQGELVRVKVGSIEHPMEENHYIEWIELRGDEEILLKFLKPGDKPQAEFQIKAERISAREYCNLHGLWKNR